MKTHTHHCNESWNHKEKRLICQNGAPPAEPAALPDTEADKIQPSERAEAPKQTGKVEKPPVSAEDAAKARETAGGFLRSVGNALQGAGMVIADYGERIRSTQNQVARGSDRRERPAPPAEPRAEAPRTAPASPTTPEARPSPDAIPGASNVPDGEPADQLAGGTEVGKDKEANKPPEGLKEGETRIQRLSRELADAIKKLGEESGTLEQKIEAFLTVMTVLADICESIKNKTLTQKIDQKPEGKIQKPEQGAETGGQTPEQQRRAAIEQRLDDQLSGRTGGPSGAPSVAPPTAPTAVQTGVPTAAPTTQPAAPSGSPEAQPVRTEHPTATVGEAPKPQEKLTLKQIIDTNNEKIKLNSEQIDAHQAQRNELDKQNSALRNVVEDLKQKLTSPDTKDADKAMIRAQISAMERQMAFNQKVIDLHNEEIKKLQSENEGLTDVNALAQERQKALQETIGIMNKGFEQAVQILKEKGLGDLAKALDGKKFEEGPGGQPVLKLLEGDIATLREAVKGVGKVEGDNANFTITMKDGASLSFQKVEGGYTLSMKAAPPAAPAPAPAAAPTDTPTNAPAPAQQATEKSPDAVVGVDNIYKATYEDTVSVLEGKINRQVAVVAAGQKEVDDVSFGERMDAILKFGGLAGDTVGMTQKEALSKDRATLDALTRMMGEVGRLNDESKSPDQKLAALKEIRERMGVPALPASIIHQQEGYAGVQTAARDALKEQKIGGVDYTVNKQLG
jgi:hypothetical protein